MDIGTGDGRFVLATARSAPETLVIGIDADAASMRDASRRAAARPTRGGVPNAVFLVSAVEALPAELHAFADRITIHFPWASLLRGLVNADPAFVEPIARLARAGATVTAILSVTDRDTAAGAATPNAALGRLLARLYWAHGLRVVEWRPASSLEIRQAHSTWSKRLRTGRERDVWFMRLVRE